MSKLSLNDGIFPIPFLSYTLIEPSDINLMTSKSDNQTNFGFELLVMNDTADMEAGLFLYVCDDGKPPDWGFSPRFCRLWKWAQKQGHNWVRLDPNGFETEEI